MSLEENVVSLTVAPKPPANEDEFGTSLVLPFGSWTSGGETELPNHAAVTEIDKLVEMRRRDGQARALIRVLTLPIRASLRDAKWIAPESEDAEGMEEEVDFANQMWTLPPTHGGMSVPFSRVMAQTLLALVEGFSVFEEVRYVPKDGPLKGKVCMKKLAHRDSRTLRFLVDSKGGFAGVRQVATASPDSGKPVDVRIPGDKCWYWAANEEENPFYGVSYFEAAYYHYDIKKKLYYIAHLAAQFAAVAGRVGEYPQSASTTQISQFKAALANFAFNTSMVHPAGYKVNPFQGGSTFDFLKLIDHHNHQMSKSVLAKFLDDEARQVLIDNGTTDATSDLLIMSLETIMSEIAESLTHHVMPKFIDWNFGSQKYPVFRFGQLADSTRDVVKDLLSAISTAQSSQWTPEFIRELEKRMTDRLGLEVDYDAVDEREEEERAKIEEQENMNRQLIAQQMGSTGREGEEGEEGGPPSGPPKVPAAPTAVAASATTGLEEIEAEVLKLAREHGLLPEDE